jgi:apolipoprotein D and lipocalin family protein
VAHAPNFFQNGCVRSTADYRVLSKTQVSVYNVCIKADGSTSDISGIATVTDPKQPAKLKVKFNLFARGDYWIVALDPQYEWAVVSGPGRNSLFILSRPAPMAKGLLTVLLQDLQRKGFDTGSLIFDEY